ncbi:hypothetical protein [Streptomyces asiaticus]|uniref:hypothetical protein n=1 Tax=Streptomyces asiaticus TaxID=114695 RepID=UPI003F67A223
MKRHDSSGAKRRASEARRTGAPESDPPEEGGEPDMEILKVLMGADVELEEAEPSREHMLKQMNDS